MTFRLRFLNGAFPLLREHVPIDNKKPQHYPAALLAFSSEIKVCCLRMSAVAGVCGWPHIRWPPLLPVHIHLTIESGKRKPSGECFRFSLRWARWNVLPGKRRIIRLAGHATYGSDFVSGWRFPLSTKNRVELCYFFYL